VDQALDIRSDGAKRWQNPQKKRKQPSKWQQGVQNQAGVEQGKGGFKLDEAKNPRQGESLNQTKTKPTAQLRTSKIHKTRRQAGGFISVTLCLWEGYISQASVNFEIP
jgi:hypothetical protein